MRGGAGSGKSTSSREGEAEEADADGVLPGWGQGQEERVTAVVRANTRKLSENYIHYVGHPAKYCISLVLTKNF